MVDEVQLTPADVYGVVSLLCWSVLVIATVTYVLLAMRADNDGEGGLLASPVAHLAWPPVAV
jgi:KUP system potassium uptake protein